MQNNIHFNCPNCSSNKYFGKTTMGKKYKEGPYKNVISEIQCSICLWIFHQTFVKIFLMMN